MLTFQLRMTGLTKNTDYKKICTLTLARHSYFLSNMQQVTIQNNLDPAYTWLKTADFNSKYLWEEELGGGLLLNFYVYLFSREK